MVFAYDFRSNRALENLLTIFSWVLYSAAFMEGSDLTVQVYFSERKVKLKLV